MVRLQSYVLAVVVCIGALAASAAEIESDRPHWKDHDAMESYRASLFGMYKICSSAASDRMLSPGEAQSCSEIYMALKMSFLKGVTIDRYMGMSPPTKRKAHDMGYAALRAWRHRRIVQVVE